MTNDRNLRSLPAVDRLLNEPALKDLCKTLPRSIVTQAARDVLDAFRVRIREGNAPTPEELATEAIARDVCAHAGALAAPTLRRAINATGVIIHTGLGRSVLSDAARDVLQTAVGACNLEIDIPTGARGSRAEHYRTLLADLCGAESALAVNNNAAAVFLVLNTLALGMEVIVSRGQLVEIGGSFRIPDIMARAGVKLVEVGTTNRTRLSDYESAITENTGLMVRVHPSNFRVVGFTEDTPVGELAELGQRHGIPVVDDLGSGALIDLSQYGLREEPLVQDSIRAGADVVLFSGDKLLGGPQAGLIVGRRDLVLAMAKSPLARALRMGKLGIAALEATLKLYMDPESAVVKVPTLRYIARPLAEIARAAQRLRRDMASSVGDAARVQVIDGLSEVGGGSLPNQQLPTRLVAVSCAQIPPLEIARRFRMSAPAIFGRVGEDRFLLDLRTVEDKEVPLIARACAEIFRQ